MKIYEKIPRDEWGVPLFRSNAREAEIKRDALGDPIMKVPGERELMKDFDPDPIDPGPDASTKSDAIRDLLKKHPVILGMLGEKFVAELTGRDTVQESRRFDSDLGPAPLPCVNNCSHPLL
jgi:hypothetical protein